MGQFTTIKQYQQLLYLGPELPVGGTNTQLQFNNNGVFGGCQGTAWDDVNRALVISGATITAQDPILDLSQTWNASGVAFTGLRFNVTDTASAAASLLMDLQLGGNTRFAVGKAGMMRLRNVNANSSDFTLDTSYRVVVSDGGLVNRYCLELNSSTGGLAIGSGQSFSFANTADATQTQDVRLYRDAGGQLGQRNGTNSQALSIYNTYTDSLNYERGRLGWNLATNKFTISSDAVGTGTQRDMGFYYSATEKLRISTNVLSLGILDMQSNNIQAIGNILLGASNDVGIFRTAAKIVNVSDGTTANLGWLITAGVGGASRLASDFSVTSNATLAATGIQSASLDVGRNYCFFAMLLMTTGASAGGIKVGLGSGGAVVSALVFDGICLDGATVIPCTRRTAFGAGNEIVANTNAGTAPILFLFGTISVSTAGAFTIRFAQNVANATASVVKAGSYLVVQDIP